MEDAAGSRVAGAQVSTEGGEGQARTTTGADGSFALVLPAGARGLRVRAAGFAEERLSLPSPPPEMLTVVLRPASRAEQITVTATLTPTRLLETPASLVALPAAALAATAAPTLDDALRQVPGFGLFRRTGSRTANPTSQGVSLRGLGASGASRALVLVDGLPLNDPFGGWVYWARVPRDAIEQVEVLRGGASDLYGSSALGGVVQVLTRAPAGAELIAQAAAGNESTWDGSLLGAGRAGDWGARLALAGQTNDGYVLVAPAGRGKVDTRAASSYATADLLLDRGFGPRGRAFLRGSLFGESRQNGTALQTNATTIRQGAAGFDWSSPELGSLRLRTDLESQVFDQSFTSVSTDRTSESLTRRQRVPARTAGLGIQWSRSVGSRQVLLAGVDLRGVRGSSDELAFLSGLPSATVDGGGRLRTFGVFAEDLFQVTPRLLLVASARFDQWRHEGGYSITEPLVSTVRAASSSFPDRSEQAVSPRLSLLFRPGAHLGLSAAAYGAFRGPTLNELYRSFRVGNTLTQANERLEAERLRGGEAGANWTTVDGRVRARVGVFSSTIRDPVASVTLSTTASLVTRQRQNLGRTRSQGVETDLQVLPARGLELSAGYALTDATVRRFPANPALEGLRLPQVPRHQLTFQGRYERAGLRVSMQGRWGGAQFEDDQNLQRLRPFWQIDAFAAHAIGRGLEAFLAAENVLGQRADVGLLPVLTQGPPFTFRAGLRLRLAGRPRP